MRIKNGAGNGRGAGTRFQSNQKGILDARTLPDADFQEQWDGIIVPDEVKERLLAQAILNFTLRGKLTRARAPLHGVILLVGPPGTGKTSLGRGLATRTADVIKNIGDFRYLEVEPHDLASASLGKSQKAVRDLLGGVIAESATAGPLIVLLDEVETLATDRSQLSLEANPVDVHRATDAVLAQLDHLAEEFPCLLFVATSNFPQAIDSAFLSRVDHIETIGLPSAAACKDILVDSVEHLAEHFPDVADVLKDRTFKTAVNKAVGLDGRALRKAVIAGCARDKLTALDPNRLTAKNICAAIDQAMAERSTEGGAS